jgi:ectoine hydroxylase-related dioxygenase (phytanoyl-CoA dioxygenase family)
VAGNRSALAFEAALAELGVAASTLIDAERRALDGDGFVVLRDAMTPDECATLRDEFERAVAEAASAPPAAPAPGMREETGTRHVAGLLSRGTLFRKVAFHPRVLAAVWHVLRRDFFLPGLAGRDPLPGFGQQALHTDWTAPARTSDDGWRFDVVTALALLDDYTRENGATRLVPGSHRARSAAPKEVSAPAFVHPRQQIVVAPAGSILVFNGHVLHSGTRHASSGPRRTLQYSFAALEHRGRYASTEAAPDPTWSEAERRLVGRALD